jgi:signal transduction histidine kinase
LTTKQTGEGSGLGLSMVYGFVTQSGGEIEIDSGPQKGTTISLILPISVTPDNREP